MIEENEKISSENEAYEPDTASLAEKIFKITEDASEKKAAKKKGMVKKQKIMLIAFASAALALILSYFIFVLPYVKKLNAEEKTEPPELLTGEYYEETTETLLLFPKVEKSQIKTLEIHNSYGTFTCVNENGSFGIKEYEYAPISSETASSLAVDAGYTVVSRRITTECEDFGMYGLGDDEENKNYYTVTDTAGNSYTVYLGDYTPNGGGIYCRYEGRSALYVLQASIANTLLCGVEGLISPLLMSPLPSTAYAQTDSVIITKKGQPFIEIIYDSYCQKCNGKLAEESGGTYKCSECGATSSSGEYRNSAYKMLYPSNHTVNDTMYSRKLLLSLCSLTGQAVLKAGTGKSGERLCDNAEIMAEFGFDDFSNVPYRLMYSFTYTDKTDNTERVQTGAVAFAPSGVDGYYFAYAYEFDTIVLVSKSTVPYLEWDLLDYVNSGIIAERIFDITKIEISTAENSYVYKNGGYYTVDEAFSIEYVQGESENKLICRADRTDKTYTSMTTQTNYIQALYTSMLSMYIEGYYAEKEAGDKYAEMKITKKDGTVIEYVFYKKGERAFYTVDGRGEFYVPIYQVNCVLINAVRAAEGCGVDNLVASPNFPDGYQND